MSKDRIQAHRIVNEIEQIERLGVQASRILAGKLRAESIRMFHRRTAGRRGQFREIVYATLRDKLRDGMIAGHLYGFHRAILMRPAAPQEPATLQLSVYSKVIELINRKAQLDLNALQQQYDTLALKVINGVADKVERKLQTVLADIIEKGVSQREAIQTLGDAFADAGISPKGDFQLETIFRTQVQMTYSAGRWEADQDEDIKDIHWGYKYVTVGDSRVREQHEALEGITLPKNDLFWSRFFPPNGWNCRCQAISIYEERPRIRPPKEDVNGDPLRPDKGFDFNPGQVFRAGKK